MHEFFFHLIFPCANIFLVLRLPPIKFSNGPCLKTLDEKQCTMSACKRMPFNEHFTE